MVSGGLAGGEDAAVDLFELAAEGCDFGLAFPLFVGLALVFGILESEVVVGSFALGYLQGEVFEGFVDEVGVAFVGGVEDSCVAAVEVGWIVLSGVAVEEDVAAAFDVAGGGGRGGVNVFHGYLDCAAVAYVHFRGAEVFAAFVVEGAPS